MHSFRTHRDPSSILVRLLLVLGLTAGALLASAQTASAGTCYEAYYAGYGTTVCTP